jgi:hypothetical protein
MLSFAGTFFSIKASLYNGVPVTSVSTDAHEPRHCKASRHDRCFHTGSGQKDARQALRVLAGRRLRSSDPRLLSDDAVQQCVAACPRAVRYALLISDFFVLISDRLCWILQMLAALESRRRLLSRQLALTSATNRSMLRVLRSPRYLDIAFPIGCTA